MTCGFLIGLCWIEKHVRSITYRLFTQNYADSDYCFKQSLHLVFLVHGIDKISVLIAGDGPIFVFAPDVYPLDLDVVFTELLEGIDQHI